MLGRDQLDRMRLNASTKGADRLKTYLDQHGVDANLIQPGSETPTVAAAAAALDVDEDQIIKSLLFQGRDGSTVVAIVRGTSKVDRRKLGQASGIRKPRLAAPETVSQCTGFEAGGTPPVGYATQLAVVMDRRVFDVDEVFGGGGEVDMMLRIQPETIRKLNRASVSDICQDP